MAEIARLFSKSCSDSSLNEAVSALFDRYGRLIYSVAVHIVGDVETAEEITQDVFIRTCEGADSYNTQFSKVSSWMVSIARHRAIDELRRRSSRPEKNNLTLSDYFTKASSGGQPLSTDVEKEVDLSIQEKNVRQVVKILPPEQRQVLELAYFKGMSHHQIADYLGEPLGTIKSRIRLGMQKLRDLLKENGIVRQN
jgi:RNA polymerase sigma-70 factor (ECF subfamily)